MHALLLPVMLMTTCASGLRSVHSTPVTADVTVVQPTPSAASHVYRSISSAWQQPCHDVTLDVTRLHTDGNDVAAGQDSIAQVSDAEQLPEQIDDLGTQVEGQDTNPQAHSSDMIQHLLLVAQSSSEIETRMASRLPSRNFVNSLEPLTIEGMAVGKLRFLTSDMPRLDTSRQAYELLARAYVYVDQMVQDENSADQNNLVDAMRQLRTQLRTQLMCPVYTYIMGTHGVHPVTGSVESQLTDLLQSRSYVTDFTHRNKMHFIVVRDLKRIVDHLLYNIYN